MTTGLHSGKQPEAIADEIGDLISRGVFLSGQHLGQAQLADHFHVSRVPVREALNILVAEGVLTHDRNCGYRVSVVSTDRMIQLTRLFRFIEWDLIRTLPWPTCDEFDRIMTLYGESRERLHADDVCGWRHKVHHVRRSVFGKTGQSHLYGELIRLWRITDLFWNNQSVSEVFPDPTPVGEPVVLAALRHRDRSQLLRAYEIERRRVDTGLRDLKRIRTSR